MVKLVDPTLPFADVVARHRRERAGAAAATFGLWASTHDWRAVYPDVTAVAGVGASEQALSDADLDFTQQVIGGSGGLLVDLGFQVCPIGAITSGMFPASLRAWVAGGTTTPEERGRCPRSGSLACGSGRAPTQSRSGRMLIRRSSGSGAVHAAVRGRSRLAARGPRGRLRVKQLVKRTTADGHG